MVGVHLPGIAGLAGKEITGTDFHTRRDVIHVRGMDMTCRSVEGRCLDTQELLKRLFGWECPGGCVKMQSLIQWVWGGT